MMKNVIEYPISYQEACDHLKVEEGEDSSLINRLIKAANSLAEDYVEQDIALTEYTKTGTIESNGVPVTKYIYLESTNFRGIEQVKVGGVVIDNYETETTIIRPDQFQVVVKITVEAEGEIEYEIKYRTGFTSGQVDESIRTAMFLKIGELYDVDRSNYTTNTYKTTSQFERILNFHKKPIFR